MIAFDSSAEEEEVREEPSTSITIASLTIGRIRGTYR